MLESYDNFSLFYISFNYKKIKGFLSILFYMAISCQFMVTFVY